MLRFMLRIAPLVVLQQPYSQEERYVKAAGIVNVVAFWTLAGIAGGVVIASCVYGYQLVQHLRSRQRRPGTPVPVQTL
jgi:hypothetical protein